MAGTPQQVLHTVRPLLLLDLDQRLQFAQMVGIAQCVHHTVQGVAGLPVAVHDHAREVCQQAAALRGDPMEGQPDVRGDVQLLRLAANPEPGLVPVPDGRCGHASANCGGKSLEAFGTILADPGDGGRDQIHTVQIAHLRGQTLLRQNFATTTCFAITTHLRQCGAVDSEIDREVNDVGHSPIVFRSGHLPHRVA